MTLIYMNDRIRMTVNPVKLNNELLLPAVDMSYKGTKIN